MMYMRFEELYTIALCHWHNCHIFNELAEFGDFQPIESIKLFVIILNTNFQTFIIKSNDLQQRRVVHTNKYGRNFINQLVVDTFKYIMVIP